ncbi:glycoside hydrolase family 92 protein [bacterium]|nr:MAG: glycoside hydrolase family 92 protein [bacterium]
MRIYPFKCLVLGLISFASPLNKVAESAPLPRKPKPPTATAIKTPPSLQAPKLSDLVNPLIGTTREGNVFPGAVAPFGMMQLSPNWDFVGYNYSSQKMHGFVLNLLSGPGVANQGQVLTTATTGPVKIDRADTDFSFDHASETAKAGYYQVRMQPWDINAEMTTTARCGLLKYTFPAGKQANILLPISYANTPTLFSNVRYVDDHTVTGAVSSEAFQGERKGITVHFVMSFSKPFNSHGTWKDNTINPGSNEAAQTDRKTVIGFYGSYPPSAQPQTVEVRIGMSYVDVEGAIKNLSAEMPTGGFEKYRAAAAAAWDKELALIEVEGGSLTHRRIFYTALYHSLIAPSIFEDTDRRYRGFDDQIHTVPAGHQHLYANFSGWDIYRTQVPLLTLIAPERCADMGQSIVEMAKQLGYIDRWPQLNATTACMNGNPLTICLATIWNAGIRNFDMETAYKYMWKQCLEGNPHSWINVFQEYEEEKGGVTLNLDSSVASSLEYNVSFAALGHLAKSLGKHDDARYLLSRAQQYRSMYNPGTGYLQGRDKNGLWDKNFEGYTEGNRDIYLWFVPHDVQGLVDLMGGPSAFDRRLDEFFATGKYDATNEPDIQSPFLYDYINRPWKTQNIVAQTADRVFTDSPGGLAGGNDDLGTMSSWYILSQLGFYPVDPGLPYFVTCTPRFSKAIIHLSAPHSGKEFVIETPAAAPENRYIQSAVLNGQPHNKPWFNQESLLKGGKWSVQVGPQANQKWGANPSDRPHSLSTGLSPVPYKPILKPIGGGGRDVPVSWRYRTDNPGTDWFITNFDDSGWKTGDGGFGTENVGVTPRTPWNTDDIYLRRTVILPENFKTLAILAYHDQDLDVYLNGVLAAHVDGWTHNYDVIPISEAAQATLHGGENLMAVHVRHAGEGRHFADASLSEIEWPENEK